MVVLIALFALIFGFAHYCSQEGRIWINSQDAQLILLKGRYRSWTMEYSYGQWWDKGKDPVNLWHWPTFRHFDMAWVTNAIAIQGSVTNFSEGGK